jgi:plastocyanin
MKTCKLALMGVLVVVAWMFVATTAEAAKTNIVEVRGPTTYIFVPSNLVINVGDTVLWTNRSSTGTHDVTQGSRAAGVTPNPYWAASGPIALNGRFSVTFSNLGAYPYICNAHVFVNPQPIGNPTQTGLVSVVIANFAPTVAITSPTDISRFTVPGNFLISADAADSDGTVTNVEFFAGNTLLGSDSVPPYSINSGSLTSGVYQLTARAFDNLGGGATSAVVHVVVNTTHTVTTSGFTFVPNALTVTVGDTVMFTGLAGHTVTGDTVAEPFCGISTPPGFTCQVTFNTVGTFAYHCNPHQAFGMAGTINVTSPINFRPIATLTKPANGSVFAAPATFEMAAEASDFGGTITQVRFIHGGTVSLGVDTTSPYAATVSNLVAGNYVLTARVTDNNSLLGTSAPVNITVVNPVNVQLLSPSNAPAGFQFNYTANPGLRYVVEGSAADGSPVPFVPLTTNVAGSNVVTFIDPTAVTRSNRAYRVFRQP